MKYLLDTSIVSEPTKPRPNAYVLEQLRRHDDECSIAASVWQELRFGVLRLPKSQRREMLERYLHEIVRASYPIVSYDEAAADWHAEERARLEKRGRTPAWVDGQIAATAAVSGAILVTANPRHFRPFRGVRVEDWTKPSRVPP